MAIRLRSPNYESVTRTTPTGGVTKGALISFQDVDGFAFGTNDETKENEETFTLITRADKVDVDYASGQTGSAITQGDVLYVDASSNATLASTGNTLCLVALENGSDATGATLTCRFDGTMAYLKA